jgi:lysine 6-dehydrogenase
MAAQRQYLVLGAGMMGRAIAHDLATAEPGSRVTLADIDGEAAARTASSIGPNVSPMQLDVRDAAGVRRALQGVSVVVSAVSYSVNLELTRAAIEAGVHMCDLGGNNSVVDAQLALRAAAETRGVTVVPNCGLAPGLINILAMTAMEQFDSVEAIHLRVGGLPQHPRPPLNYQIVFSVEGLLNEYIEPSTVIRDGRIAAVESMTEVESLEFPAPFGIMEAFHTSGGISILPRLLSGKVGTLDYKTIRYPGHCERFRMLLDIGFAGSEPVLLGDTVRTAREVFTELLRRRLSGGGPDLVLARAEANGSFSGRDRRLRYELIDHHDPATGMSAMMRTTGFPTAITAQMLASGVISRRGVLAPEECVPGDDMIAALTRRGIHIRTIINDETRP